MAPEYQKQRGRCPLFRFRYVRLFAQVARMYGLCSQNVCPFKYIMWGNIIQEREQQHPVYGITLTVRVSCYFSG